MIPIEDLRRENESIKALSDVLATLVPEKKLRSNKVFCELLQRFQHNMNNHLKHEARSIYPELLNHDDKKIKQVAKDFLSNTHELERILSSYVKHWCSHISDENHDEFKRETMEIFRLVDARIKMEESHLFTVL